MKKFIYSGLVAAAILTAAPSVGSAVSAGGCAVIEAASRQILYADNADERMGMASTTKIMTAAVALENAPADKLITVSRSAQNQEGTRIYLNEGEKITLQSLLYGLMLNSGNDAAVAIAEGVSGDEASFVRLMNEKAAELGCHNTNFKNPSGLPAEGHYSTARDMALIMAYAMENPEFAKIAATREYQIQMPNAVTYLKNHNRLLWSSEDCIGGKTGYTRAAGRCLVTCAERGGMRIIAVTLNDRDDWNDHVRLYDYAFERLERRRVVTKNDILCTREIGGARVDILAAEGFSMTALKGKGARLVCRLHLAAAPGEIAVGTPLGRAELFSGEYKIGEIAVKSGTEAMRGRVFADEVKRLFRMALPD